MQISHKFLHLTRGGIAHLHQGASVANRTVAETVIPSVVRRAAESSATCSSNADSNTCEKPSGSGGTGSMIIGLSAGIPIVAAALLLFFLHRRIKRRQAHEDANDKHASLDFGLDNVSSGGPNKSNKVPEMVVTDTEKSIRPGGRKGGRGMSMDMGSPYLLPAAMNGSRESFHSMSRSMHDAEDPYGPVARSDTDSVRGPQLPKKGNASTYTRSTKRSKESMDAPMLKNASRMSRYDPNEPSSPEDNQSVDMAVYNPPPRKQSLSTAQPQPAFRPRKDSIQQRTVAQRAPPPAPLNLQASAPSQHFNLDVTAPSPVQPRPVSGRYSIDASSTMIHQPVSQPTAYAQDAQRASVMGLRPLPPDDPAEDPEQRANRIRSFYKEYFDDSRPHPPMPPMHRGPYENEYVADLYGDGGMYDGGYGQVQAPFAQPMGRRAMTPPPRGAAQIDERHRSQNSVQSTGRMNNRPPPKKQLPPPSALTSLPSPHLVGDGLSLVDFAPPITYRDRQAGRRPDSPLGVQRPYSPAVPVHSPLVKSYDDLAMMPSPYALRKSGTFTALDFALPPRFKNQEGNASDAGSIRSNRSGISAVQREAVRAGAYRVSRIPKEMVGTTSDLAQTLKPTWDVRAN